MLRIKEPTTAIQTIINRKRTTEIKQSAGELWEMNENELVKDSDGEDSFPAM